MSSFVSPANGAEVVAVSCFDPEHPPTHALDGSMQTFWSTTGLYPQEMIVKLGDTQHLARLRVQSTNVRQLVVERCATESMSEWEEVAILDMESMDGALQDERAVLRGAARFLRFKITSGFDAFATVHNVVVT